MSDTYPITQNSHFQLYQLHIVLILNTQIVKIFTYILQSTSVAVTDDQF